MKVKIIILIIKIIIQLIILSIGFGYIYYSINGDSISYISLDNFMQAIGVKDGDIANVNGCFLCKYINELFSFLGNTTENFWKLIIKTLWILIVIGFGVFIFTNTIKYLFDKMKINYDFNDTNEDNKELSFKSWFEPIWKQGLRLIIAGTLIGALGLGGNSALKTIANITITPVIYLGTSLSMLATGTYEYANCKIDNNQINKDKNNLLNPILKPLMCSIGNVNTIILAGAAGGFSLMNYSYITDINIITWIIGVLIVILFLRIGFSLVFDILNIVFKLIFLIIFLPLIISAYSFQKSWSLASNLVKNSIQMLITSSISMIKIALKTIIIYAIISFSADEYFPGPADGFNAVFPQLLKSSNYNPDTETLSIIKVFKTCETQSKIDGNIDKYKFRDCFNAQRMNIERKYPNAFDFMSNSFEFLLLVIFIYFIYFYILDKKVNSVLNIPEDNFFEFGTTIKNSILSVKKAIDTILNKAGKRFGKKA